MKNQPPVAHVLKTYLLFAPMMRPQMVPLSADVTSASSDDASVAPVITGLNDTVSAGGEASESSAGLADDSASAGEALSKSVRTESNDAGPREDVNLGSGGVSGSRNTRRKPLKRNRRVFGRMLMPELL